MIKKSISITDQQNDWIKAQIELGHYGNDSEVIRELIRERQLRELDTDKEIQRVRALLVEAEKSGFTSQSAEELLSEIKQKMRLNGKI